MMYSATILRGVGGMKKLCDKAAHDWEEVGKCKDGLGRHPCEYHPDGCNTCMDRFTCFTKDNPDMYRTRFTGKFFACKKCPAVMFEGTVKVWEEREHTSILDCRNQRFIMMDKTLAERLTDKWKGK